MMTILASGGDPPWIPKIPSGPEPLSARLAQALAEDVRAGVLAAGDRLPTHRELAYVLNIGVATVTRAYAAVEAEGLIAAHVGRGTFVAPQPEFRPETAPEAEGVIDLGRNLPPMAPAERRLKETWLSLADGRLLERLAYAPPGGGEAHRRAGAAWIGRTIAAEPPDWSRLLVCTGAQEAMALTFARLCRTGDLVLTEAATFFGLRTLADYAGFRLEGVAMDDEGLAPDRAARRTGAKVLYTMPTLQNPTGRTMSMARRADIVRIARRHDMVIVEDDVYAAASAAKQTPLAALAPERTFYISSLSKALAPGLRTGYVVAPDRDAFESLVQGVRARTYAPPSMEGSIAAAWIETGTADAIAQEVRAEIAVRRAMAEAILGSAVERGFGDAPHVWAPLSELAAERVAGRCLRAGVAVTPPSAPVIAPTLISGIRLCLGTPRPRAALERALNVVKDALNSDPARAASGLV